MTSTALDRLPGALVISLDFEFHWGVRDRRSAQGSYAASLLGARTVIPRILELFEEFEVAATWATVGFLFASSRAEVERHSPALRPAYRKAELVPYLEWIGANEQADPMHLGASLVRRIRGGARQEIATHTFSHYCCGEEGQDRQTFRADLDAARSIAAHSGIELRSIVFPRNQHNPAYDDILKDAGIRAYRGNPPSRLWRFDDSEGSNRTWKRGGRLADAYLGGRGGTVPWGEVMQPCGLSDVRASAMLRSYRPRLRHLEPLRLGRVLRSLRFAARERRIFHLWWHPHNFGLYQDENLDFLRGILREFAVCRERRGMESLSMAEVDDRVRRGTGVGGSSPGYGGQQGTEDGGEHSQGVQAVLPGGAAAR
jgi:peptidoglycan/xylan/chitin deacetylase (PgdA/CDA1 family)